MSVLPRPPALIATLAVIAVTTAGCSEAGSAAPAVAGGVPASTVGAPVGEATLADVPQLVRDVEPSVVTIFTEGGLGSGVVYREDGVIVTNEHVVRGSAEVEVAFADGQRAAGQVLAADVATDLAVVQTDRADLPAADFQPELPQVGELAVALGSPLGFESTATAGIISGLGREVPGSAQRSRALVDLIQTDAAISPGNSGGALVNGAGQVVGINDAYIPPAAGAVSIGFAIPTATVVDIAEQLLDTGQVRRPFVGITPGRITPELAQRFGLAETEGVLVLQVVPDSPAEQAGLRPGDVVTDVDGERVRSVEQFLGELRGLEIGEQVRVLLLRDGEPTAVSLTLAEAR